MGYVCAACTGVRVRSAHRMVTNHFCSLRVGSCAGFCVCWFWALTRQIFAMGTGEVQNLYGFDGENRIGEVMWGEVNLTCAVEFPILFLPVTYEMPLSGRHFTPLACGTRHIGELRLAPKQLLKPWHHKPNPIAPSLFGLIYRRNCLLALVNVSEFY